MANKIFYQFLIGVYQNGEQRIMAFTSPSIKLPMLLSHFLNISELEWYKNEVLKARKVGKREYTGQNTFVCFVNGEMCEIGHEENRNDLKAFDSVPTEIVLNFIDDAIKFHELYNSGEILGIIPESKKDDWIIVPKEFVKDEYRIIDSEEE